MVRKIIKIQNAKNWAKIYTVLCRLDSKVDLIVERKLLK